MKKNIIILAIIVFLSPLVTHAAWWNPGTWFNNSGFIKSNRLERKLEKIQKKELQKNTEAQEDEIIEDSEKGAEVIKSEKNKKESSEKPTTPRAPSVVPTVILPPQASGTPAVNNLNEKLLD